MFSKNTYYPLIYIHFILFILINYIKLDCGLPIQYNEKYVTKTKSRTTGQAYNATEPLKKRWPTPQS